MIFILKEVSEKVSMVMLIVSVVLCNVSRFTCDIYSLKSHHNPHGNQQTMYNTSKCKFSSFNKMRFF